jgi:endonuclease III
MFKPLLTSTATLALLLVGSLPGVAQSQQTAPSRENQQAPQGQQQPAPQGQQQAPQAKDISQEELEKFANAVEQIQTIQQESQQQMAQAVESTGLSKQRYKQIGKAQRNPNAEGTSEVSDQEMQKFQQAQSKLAEIQKQSQSKMEQAVKDVGLEMQQFNRIFAAIQDNDELQKKVRQMIQK